MTRAVRGRGARTAAAVAGLLAVVLVAVLVELLSPGTDPAPRSRAPVASSASPVTSPSRTPSPSATSGRDPDTGLRLVALADLPAQARDTVALIDRGGPYPYAQDGVTFGNYEGHLPSRPRGWYREYTVRTPGERDRGPRRIVTGDDDRLFFYTADHYATFVRVAR